MKKSAVFYVLMTLMVIFLYVCPMGYVLYSIYDIREELKLPEEYISHPFEIEKDGTVSIENGSLIISKGVKTEYDASEEMVMLDGYIENKMNETVQDVNLNFEMVDKNGVVLGTLNCYVEYIKSGQTWKASTSFSDPMLKDVKTYRLASVDYDIKSSNN